MILFEKEKCSLLALFSDIKETTLFYNNKHVKMENYNLNNITFLEAHHDIIFCVSLYTLFESQLAMYSFNFSYKIINV